MIEILEKLSLDEAKALCLDLERVRESVLALSPEKEREEVKALLNEIGKKFGV